MTIQRRDGNSTPFGLWIREEERLDSISARLSVTDNDYWIHRYRAHNDKVGERGIDSIMCVEVKTYNRDLPFAQKDTITLLSEVFKKVYRTTDGKIRTTKVKLEYEIRLVRMYGYFVLRIDTDRPDTANWIQWDRKQITLSDLVDVLAFERDPRTLMPRSERRHHVPNRIYNTISLFPD